jgi:putative ABC transport system substrate-binding protein
MRRREFITLIGGAAVAMPLAARAQAAMPVIGIISGTNREERLLDAIRQGLSEAGFAEGRNVAFEYRWAEGHFDRLPAMATDLVARKVGAIIAMQSTTAPLAAKAATSTIPIVFSIGADPVKLGLVASLNRPGGNITGATFLVNSLAAKRLELLSEMVPKGSTIGLFVNPNNPAAKSETADVEAAARTLGLSLFAQNASSAQEIDKGFAAFVDKRVAGITFAADAVYNARRAQLIALAQRHKVPAVYFYRAFAEDGGLMSYGGFDTDAYRLAGVYAGRVLKGEKPADLPVQQVTKIELVVNLKTAKAQALTLPGTLLARADGVIE